jgi:flagellar basal body-associated protein FliL
MHCNRDGSTMIIIIFFIIIFFIIFFLFFLSFFSRRESVAERQTYSFVPTGAHADDGCRNSDSLRPAHRRDTAENRRSR